MTPAARVQAAIEVLEAIDESRRAADRLLRDYVRRRRFIGSKDRRAIRDLVYKILRHRGALDWRIEQAGGAPSARTRALAWLTQDVPDGDAAALFTGAGYGPAALDADESTLAARLADGSVDVGAMPAAARVNCPAWLYPLFQERFGAETEAELAALNRLATLDLRVNEARADRDGTVAALRSLGFDCAPTPLSPIGIRLADHADISALPLYRDGTVEIQDEGAQIAALLVDVAPSGTPVERVIDLCAGAGGKTLAMAARLPQGLIACDSDATRLGYLAPRLARSGATGVQTVAIAEDGDSWLDGEAGTADRVLVDAPCSGTGTWRREPETRWRLDADGLAVWQARQDALLATGARLVKPGGRLVYVTCSLLAAENEDRVAHFLATHGAFETVPAATVWRDVIGGPAPAESPALTLTPARDGTDGFFVAIFERRPVTRPALDWRARWHYVSAIQEGRAKLMPHIRLVAAAAAILALGASSAAANQGGISLAPSAEDLAAAHQEATDLIDAGDYESALIKLNGMLVRQEEDAEAHNLIGYTHRRMQNYDLAFASYTRALEIDPEHTGAHNYIGEAYLETGDVAMAEHHLAKLDLICLFGCDDYYELEEAVALYRANHSS